MPKSTYYSKIHKYENLGLIRKSKFRGRYLLTPFAQKLLRKPQKYSRRSDGLSTIVIFDIPEKAKRERNILRRFLIKHKFTQLQKSTLISPYQCNQELKDLIKEFKLESFVKILGGKIE